MKYIKIYESEYEYNIGDYVRCSDCGTSPYIVGTVIKMRESPSGGKFYQVKYLYNNSVWRHWADKYSIIKLTPEEIKKYEIENDTYKYNI